jgi:hypothetical protein
VSLPLKQIPPEALEWLELLRKSIEQGFAEFDREAEDNIELDDIESFIAELDDETRCRG